MYETGQAGCADWMKIKREIICRIGEKVKKGLYFYVIASKRGKRGGEGSGPPSPRPLSLVPLSLGSHSSSQKKYIVWNEEILVKMGIILEII